MKTALCACFGSEEAKYSIGLIKEKKNIGESKLR